MLTAVATLIYTWHHNSRLHKWTVRQHNMSVVAEAEENFRMYMEEMRLNMLRPIAQTWIQLLRLQKECETTDGVLSLEEGEPAVIVDFSGLFMFDPNIGEQMWRDFNECRPVNEENVDYMLREVQRNYTEFAEWLDELEETSVQELRDRMFSLIDGQRYGDPEA